VYLERLELFSRVSILSTHNFAMIHEIGHRTITVKISLHEFLAPSWYSLLILFQKTTNEKHQKITSKINFSYIMKAIWLLEKFCYLLSLIISVLFIWKWIRVPISAIRIVDGIKGEKIKASVIMLTKSDSQIWILMLKSIACNITCLIGNKIAFVRLYTTK
jgi:hypothetical protein